MADWTASKGSFVRPYRSPYGSPMIRYFEASTNASTTGLIRVGDFVQFDTCNSLATDWRIAVAQSTGGNGGNLLGINGNNLLGIAVESDVSDGTTSGIGVNRKIGVALFYHEQEFLGYLRGNNASASSLVGKPKSVIRDSTNRIWQIDSTNSTSALQTVIITDIPEGTIGDTGGPVIFKMYLSTLVHAMVNA